MLSQALKLLAPLAPLVIVALILVAAWFLGRTLRNHLPEPRSGYVSPIARSVLVFLWLWEPALWFFPGILWYWSLGLDLWLVLMISFLLPVSVIMLLYVATVVVGRYGTKSTLLRGSSLMLAIMVWLFTLMLVRMGFRIEGVSQLRYVLFLISGLAGPCILVFNLMSQAPKVVPVGPWVERPARAALAILVGYATSAPKPSWVIEDGKVRERIKGNVFMGAGPGFLLTEPENVVLLKAGPKPTRVAGPGVVLTENGEEPNRVIDLRNQIRTASVNAVTRDGIEVLVPISSLFSINRGPGKIQLGLPWPYRNQRDIFQAVFAEEVEPAGNSPMESRAPSPWENLPLTIAAHKLKQAVSFYSLDQLLGGIADPDKALVDPNPAEADLMATHERVQEALGLKPVMRVADPLTRTTIGKLVRRAVQAAMARSGLDVFGGGVGNKIMPLRREVVEQRVDEWKSRFVIKVMDWRAELQKSRMETMETVRRNSEEAIVGDIITKTNQQIAEYGPEIGQELVAYQLVYNLLQVARDPDVQKMLPASALPTLEDLLKQVGGTDEPGTGGAS